MLAYLMLAALSYAIFRIMLLFSFFFANAFCYHVLSWFIDTQFVYFKYDFPTS